MLLCESGHGSILTTDKFANQECIFGTDGNPYCIITLRNKLRYHDKLLILDCCRSFINLCERKNLEYKDTHTKGEIYVIL